MWRLILLVLIIVAAVVAYEREWVKFGWQNRDDGKTNASVIVDRDKVKSDVREFEEKARHALTPNSQKAIRGAVKSIQSEEIAVRTDDDSVVKAKLTSKTSIRKDGRVIPIGDIRVGDRVAITAVDSLGERAAESIVVEEKHE